MKFKDAEEYKPGDVLISSEQIQSKLIEIAKKIAHDYSGKELVIIAVMKGSFMVLADMIRELYKANLRTTKVSAVTVGRYGSKIASDSKPKFKHEIDIDVKNVDVLLVEDIIDTGLTLDFVKKELSSRGANSVKCFSLLSKPSRRKITIEPDYVGFVIPNVWIQGYGLDTDEKGRSNPNIIIGPYQD